MQPSRALYNSIPASAAADTAFLAAVAAMHVHLAAANFTPDLDIDVASFVEATFTGGGPLDAGTGTQTVFYDVATGLLTIEILEPAGGWHWDCTVTPGSPETIYGIYVTDNADAVLIGCQLFDVPLTISAAGEGLDVDKIQLRFLLTSPF